MSFRIARTWALIGLLCCLLACSKDPAALRDSAKALEEKGDLSAAIVTLKAAVQASPDDGELRYWLGKLHAKTFDFPVAEKEFSKALELGVSDGGKVQVALGHALRGQAKFKEMLERVVDIADAPASVRAGLLALRGRAEIALEQPKDAQRSYETAVALDPSNPDVQLLHAQLLTTQSELQQALDVLNALLKQSPEVYDGWMYQGEILNAMERWPDALAAYDEALKLHPLSLPALLRRSLLLIQQSDIERARKDVQVLMKHFKAAPDTSVRAGMLALAEGKYEQALDHGRTALSKDAKLGAAHLLVGLAQYALGSYEQSEEALRQVVNASPGNALARRTLAQTLLKRKQAERAVEVLEPLLKQEGLESRTMAVIANAYTAAGRHEEANLWFERAALERPNDPKYAVMRAIGRMGSGEINAGLDALESAVEKLQGATRADEILMLALLGRGDVERASTLAAKLEETAPDEPITHNLKGMLAVVKGDKAASVAAFEQALKVEPRFLPAAKNLAQMDLAEGKVEQARERFRRVVEADPKNVAPLLALAKFETSQGQRPAAIAALTRAVRIDPKSAEAQERLVANYLAAGDLENAQDAALESLVALPTNPRLIRVAAVALRANGRNDQANDTILKLLQPGPPTPALTVKVAKFQESLGLSDQAEKTLRDALKKSPTASELQTGLVSLLLAQKRIDDALGFARDIASREPQSPKGPTLEGEVLHVAQRYDEAIVAYDRALSRQQAGQIAIKRFVARNAAGAGDEALAELEAWSKAHDDDAFAHAALGDLLLAKQDFAAATRHYEKVVASNSAPVDLLNKLAWLYHRDKNPRAQQIAEAAYSAAPDSGMVADTLGWILMGTQDSRRGLELLKRAAQLQQDDPEVRYHLAYALAKHEERDRAKAELAKILTPDTVFESKKEAEALMKTLQ